MSIISAFIVYYLFKKTAKKEVETIKKDLKNEISGWLNSETGQKAIYSIGALIGNGAKAGIGMKNTSGKFKWDNLLGQIVGTYVQNKVIPSLGGLSGQTNTSTVKPSSSNDLNIH